MAPAEKAVAKAQNQVQKAENTLKQFATGSKNHTQASIGVNQAKTKLTTAQLNKEVSQSVFQRVTNTISGLAGSVSGEKIKKFFGIGN